MTDGGNSCVIYDCSGCSRLCHDAFHRICGDDCGDSGYCEKWYGMRRESYGCIGKWRRIN